MARQEISRTSILLGCVRTLRQGYLPKVTQGAASRAPYLFDQGLSSLNNLLISVLIARSSSSFDELGRFNLPFTIYISALGLQRAGLLEAVMVSGSSPAIARGAQKISLLSSLTIGAAVVILGLRRGDSLVMVVGAGLPGLLLFDVIRYQNLRSGRQWRAALMNGLWFIFTLAVGVFLGSEPVLIVTIWVIAALLVSFAVIPFSGLGWWRKGDVSAWFTSSRGVSGASLCESAIYQFGWQLPFAIVLESVSIAIAGQYRIVASLLAPLGVLTSSLTILAYGKLRDNPDSLQASRRLALQILGLSLLYLTVCLILRNLFAATVFKAPSDLSVAMFILIAVQIPIQAAGAQIGVWFKLVRAAKYVLYSRLFGTFSVLATIATAYSLHSALVAVSALSAGVLTSALVLTLFQAQASRRVEA